jgi:tripartite-type tricarboxylate transporter receptor subunit TctC
MKKITHSVVLRAAFSAFSLLAFSMASAQEFPNRPIKLVVGVAPGGTIDAAARAIAEGLSSQLKVRVLVENKSGAAGAIAAESVAALEDDGHTLLVAFPTLTALPVFSKSFKLDMATDFKPVGIFAKSPFVLFAGPKLKVTGVSQLISYAKQHPKDVTFGSGDATTRLAGELFANLTGTELLHVGYRGGGPMVIDVTGGQIDMGFLAVPAVLQMHKAGKLRILAAANETRLASLPDVPTLEELGVKGYTLQPWIGLLAPVRMPSASVAKLETALRSALHDETVQRRLREMGLEPGYRDSAAFKQVITNELASFKSIALKAGIKPE